MKKIVLKLLEGIVRSMRKILVWEPFYNVFRKKANRKMLVEYTMRKGAVELDGSGYHVLKLERPEGLSNKGYNIYVDDELVCHVDDKTGKVYFPEGAIKNNYELVTHVRKILRNLSKGGLRLNESFREYFEMKDNDESRYDRSYESNISSHLTAIGWQIF